MTCLHLLGQGAEGPCAGARARELVGGVALVLRAVLVVQVALVLGATLVVWAALWVQAAMLEGAVLAGWTALAGGVGGGDSVISMVGEGEGDAVTSMAEVGDAGTSITGEGGR